ncbi:unnamed protein product [Linum trigynum]|uniref:Uncharacterized protein n=1 Tax=Linum trigynum TaxID=586398 RepID=A0AAV2E391_9ROSI
MPIKQTDINLLSNRNQRPVTYFQLGASNKVMPMLNAHNNSTGDSMIPKDITIKDTGTSRKGLGTKNNGTPSR